MALMDSLTSPRGLTFDKYLVRYCGHSLLNRVFAWQSDIQARPALLLRTQGRKTGVWREVVLPYFPHGEELVVVGSKGGLPEDPQWVGNLRAHPQAEIFVDRRLRLVTARLAEGEEYTLLWERITGVVPTYAEYQRSCQGVRQIPLVILGQV